MALGNATAGGDYLTSDEWVELGDEKVNEDVPGVGQVRSVVMIARLKTVEPATEMPKSTVYPVVVDFLFLSGSRKGEVWRDQRLIGNGQTRPLRKIAIGDDMAATAGIGKNGATEYSQLNPCGERDFELVAQTFASVAGTKHDNNPYDAAEEAANGVPVTSNGLVNSGQTSGGTKPWDRA
jgi:hypothetical protein